MRCQSAPISPRATGFTLIELLVVLMIMSLVLSLVGPAIQKIHAQHMAQQEMRLLSQYVRNASAFAYTKNEVVTLNAQNNRIVARLMPLSAQVLQENETQVSRALANDHVFAGGRQILKPDFDTADNSEATDALQETLFEHRFSYLSLMPTVFEALPSGYITVDSLQVSIGSGQITKDVALQGLRFTEWFQP